VLRSFGETSTTLSPPLFFSTVLRFAELVKQV
jgi:hypothetical protein